MLPRMDIPHMLPHTPTVDTLTPPTLVPGPMPILATPQPGRTAMDTLDTLAASPHTGEVVTTGKFWTYRYLYHV